jgi:hypothetical protein
MVRMRRFKLQTLICTVTAFAGWFSLFNAVPFVLLVFPVGIGLFVLLLLEMSLDDKRDRERRSLYRAGRWIGFSGIAAWAIHVVFRWDQFSELLRD